MRRIFARRIRLICIISIPLAVLFFASLTTHAQKYPPPFPRLGALKVPVLKGPGENPRGDMEIWEVLRQKGQPSPMCELPMDQVTVHITEGAVKYTRPDGSFRIEQERLGQVRYEPKGTIVQEEGLNELPSRSFVFQITNGAHAHLAPVTPGMPGQWPRIDATKLFETDTFNVWDQIWLPNRPITKHLHYNQAAYVMLTGGALTSAWKTGHVLTMGPVKEPHEETWSGGEPRAIWVELK